MVGNWMILVLLLLVLSWMNRELVRNWMVWLTHCWSWCMGFPGDMVMYTHLDDTEIDDF
jgi:hypothetical protein